MSTRRYDLAERRTEPHYPSVGRPTLPPEWGASLPSVGPLLLETVDCYSSETLLINKLVPPPAFRRSQSSVDMIKPRETEVICVWHGWLVISTRHIWTYICVLKFSTHFSIINIIVWNSFEWHLRRIGIDPENHLQKYTTTLFFCFYFLRHMKDEFFNRKSYIFISKNPMR